VVGAVAGVVGAVASVVRAVADEDVFDADRICTSSVGVAVKLLMPVVQVIWPTMNERPSAMTAESGMMTILLAWEAVRTPPTWRVTIDETWSAVYQGVCPR
jgi:ABC-type xylose transport system permease subunit